MVAVFYSPFKGHGSATSNVLSIGAMFALGYHKQVFLLQSRAGFCPLEDFILKKPENLKKSEIIDDYGIDALVRKRKLSSIDKQMLIESSYSMLNGRLHVLPGSRQKNSEIYKTNMQINLSEVLYAAAENFEIVLLEFDGMEGISYDSLTHAADVCVINLYQNRQMLQRLAKEEVCHNSHVFYLFGRYQAKSRYNINNLRLLYPFLTRKNSSFIEYNLSFQEAAWEAGIIRLFTENYQPGKKNKHASYFQSVHTAAGLLLNKAGENTD